MDKKRLLPAALAALSLALPAAAADFYVTPEGKFAGDGSPQSPWSFAKALSHPASVKPGDTIWLRGGTYVGPFASQLKGTMERPILVRQYPGERVTLDGNFGTDQPTITVRGSYTWFWGLEVTDSDPTRSADATGPFPRGTAILLISRGSRLINMVIHDASQGILTNDAAPDAEINGCLIYYNGYDQPDRGHGHGIYIQNETGFKRVIDNIIFQQFGWGVHGYTEGAELDNLYFEGNTSFNNGLLSNVSGAQTNFLIGASGQAAPAPDASAKVAKKTSLVRNYSYFSTAYGIAANLGYSKGIASPTLLDNYLAGGLATGRSLSLANAFRPITMTGNTLIGRIGGFESTEFPSNAYITTRPTGIRVFVRPNQYEPGRAHITVYNWDRAGTVGVSLKGILEPGTPYEVRNAQNFYGPPVLSGVYDGSASLPLPMTGLVPATPVGVPTPSESGPDFQVFVVVPKPPASNGKRPAATFSFTPAFPEAGQAVSFADMSRGAVDSHAWDFGDAASGSGNISAAAAPTHTFAQAGTYLVRLTVASPGGSSTRTREVTVSASPGTHVATLPVAGHVLGAGGETFVTDVVIENPTPAAVSARLVFSPSGGDPPRESVLSLSPGETRALADVVASEFGVDDALGSLRVETEGSPPARLRAAGRVYIDHEGLTLGLGAVAQPAGEGGSGVRYVSNLVLSGAFRTNVGALNPGQEELIFSLLLRADSGNIVGRATLSLPPGAQRQWALSQLFPGVTGAGLTAEIRPLGGGLAPIAYAAVTDNESSDPTYYAAVAPSPVQYVPGIAGISGVGGAYFRSEISIVNSGHAPATVTVTLLEHDRNNTVAPKNTFVLGPHGTFHADDALQTLFGVTETFGALKVEADTTPGVTVFERILTDSTTTAGTVGQQVDAISAENLVSRGALLGVRQDAAFRTNVGLVNPDTTTATVTLRLLRPPAHELGTASVAVPPLGYVQRNLAALFPGATLPEGEVVSIRVDGGSHPIFSFASVIDNASRDPTFYPQQP